MRRQLWMALGATVLCLVACHSRKAVQTTPPPAQQLVAEPVTKVIPTVDSTVSRTRSEAIAAGIAYLQTAPWELDFVYLYSYLQAKMGWPDLAAQRDNARIADSLRGANTAASMRILDQMTLFERLRDPAFQLPSAMMAAAMEEDALTVPALYCDVYRLDSARYFPLLRQEAAAGDYHLTHAMLAYLWLREHECFSQRDLQPLYDALIAGHRELIARFPMWLDLKMEAAALMQAAGEPIPQNWISEVLAAQGADGGWIDIPQHSKSNTHTTILALWLLSGDRR